MLKCLKSYADWYPEDAKELDERLWIEMADRAGVTVETLHSARGIVFFDGYFGPMTDLDYAEEGHRITKDQAFKIVEKARQHRFQDIEFQNPEYPDACDCNQGDEERDDWETVDCQHPNCVIEGSTIYDEVWKEYRAIYG